MGKGKGKGTGCCSDNSIAPDGKIEPPNPARGDRSCTDILFFLIWAAFLFGMGVCAYMGFTKGDITELFYFIDYTGKKCGVEGRGKYTYYTVPGNQNSNICVDKCPPPLAPDGSGKFLMFTLDKDTTGEYNGYDGSYGTAAEVTASRTAGCLSEASPPTTQNGVGACGVYASTAPSGLYFCVADDLTKSGFGEGVSSAASDVLDGFGEKVKSVVADLIAGWWILAIAAGVSLVLSFVWIQLLKYCAGCFVWAVLIGSVLITALMSFASWHLYHYYTDEYAKYDIKNDESLSYIFLVLCCIFGLMALILLCMVICLCKKIRIAVGIVKEACEAVSAMPMVVLFPLCQYLILLMFVAFWVVVAGYMASTGEVKQSGEGNATTYAIEFEEELIHAMLYWAFGLLWVVAFLRHFTICVIAGAVGGWYWTPYIDGAKNGLPSAPVCSSAWRTFRYHIGTIAFGSFIIAVVEAVQIVMEYIKKKYMDENPCLTIIASYIQCCLECFKRIMEFISRNAYVITACKGKNFCSAAFEAFNYILDNVAQVSAVTWVAAYLMLLGKVLVVLGTVGICFLVSATNDEISSQVVLLVVCAVIAYSVAGMFLTVFETAIDTILMCFCWEQSAKGSFTGGFVYATEHLNCFIEGINVEAATCSEQRQEKSTDKDDVKAFNG